MDKTTKKLALYGLFAALTVVATMIFKIPVPSFNIYFNMGESVIYLAAFLYGGPAGAIIGGVASALADIIGGYPVWAPITLVIKGVEGYLVGTMAKKTSPILAITIGAIPMVIGYPSIAGILYGVAAIPIEFMLSLLQVIVGAVIALFLYPRLKNLSTDDEE